jgi:ParB-like chromosome segregation protein Spo0J
MANPYQMMPPLSDEVLTALKADIAKNGIRSPVDVDEDGNILDGHHRAQIAQELEMDCPRRVLKSLNEDQKLEHVFAVNLHRRQLGPISWAQAFEQLCKFRGVKLGQGQRNDKTSAKMAEVAEAVGVAPRTARRHLQLAKDLEKHPDLAVKVDAGEMSPEAARAKLRQKRKAARPAPTPLPPGDPSIDIREGDLREVLSDVEPESVDLIFTDPPYEVASVGLYGELGALAVKVLKPGGLCVAYSGLYALPDTMAQLGQHLDYWWCYAIVYDGNFEQCYPRCINQRWKPLLVYRRPGDDPPWVADVVTGNRRSKSHHPHEQSTVEATYWIGELTQEGNLVVDPFVGSGTTAVVCRDLGRRFIGCDVDAEAVNTANIRLRGATLVESVARKPRRSSKAAKATKASRPRKAAATRSGGSTD